MAPCAAGAAPPQEAWYVTSVGGSGSPTALVEPNKVTVRPRRIMAVDASGNAYVTGASFDGNDWDYLTQKFDPNGAPLWSATYDGPAHDDDFAAAIVVDAAGDVIVTGVSLGIGTGRDYATLKYSGATGSLMWSGLAQGVVRYDFALGFDEPKDVAVDSVGDVFVTGGSNGGFATLKYSGASGAILWTGFPDGAALLSGGAANAIAVDAAGDVVVTGGFQVGANNGAYATLKYSGSTGAPLWAGLPNGAALYDGSLFGLEAANDVGIDAFGDVIVTGGSEGIGTGQDFATVKYLGASGAIAWTGLTDGAARYTRPAPVQVNGKDVAYAVAIDAAGDVVVTGESAGEGTDQDFVTLKYIGTTGAIAWTGLPAGAARYDYNGTPDFSLSLALNSVGDVAVTGYSGGGFMGGLNDYATVKYLGSTGALAWSGLPGGAARYDSALGPDQAFAVAFDDEDDLRVAGTRAFDDFGVLRYDGASGSQTWFAREATANGKPDRLPTSRALAVDASGNTYVAGCRLNEDSDFLTEKYDSDGALLWSTEYDHAGEDDCLVALALDGFGDVVVTGRATPKR